MIAIAWFTTLPRAVKLGLAALVGVLLAWALWSLWLGNHDEAVIDRHEDKRNEAAAPASEKAATERADDALLNAELRAERDEAIAKAEALEAAKAPEARATIAPTTVALNCARLRQAYTAGELAKMAGYREACRS